MIPLRDENPTRAFPIITLSIIAINIAVFIYEIALGEAAEGRINQYAVIPYDIIHLAGPGALVTLVTSLFLHGGIAHIAGNMLYLWVFGNNIEDRLGRLRFVFFYLFCGIAATFGHILSGPDSRLPVIGASGAISGVLGAYLLLYPRAKVLVLIPIFFFWRIAKIPAFWFLIIWIALQSLWGAASFALTGQEAQGGVAWFAHIAGFFAGMVFLGIFLKRRSA